MARKGLVVKYNVPMRYARRNLALAYLAGRRSGLRDLAARAFFDHAIGMLGQAIAKFGPEGAAPFALPVLGEAGLADMLARLAEDPEKIEAAVKALDAHPEAILLPGVCHVCGCTDDAACDGGCSWADDARTICTKCKAEGMVPDGPGTPAPIRVVVVNRERILIRWLLATEYAYHQALKFGMEREDLVRLADGFAAPALTMVERLKLIDQVDAVAAKRKGGA
jgi:hypothetical protein